MTKLKRAIQQSTELSKLTLLSKQKLLYEMCERKVYKASLRLYSKGRLEDSSILSVKGRVNLLFHAAEVAL